MTSKLVDQIFYTFILFSLCLVFKCQVTVFTSLGLWVNSEGLVEREKKGI